MSLAVTDETVYLPIMLFFKLDEFGFPVFETEAIDKAVLVPDTPPFFTFLPLEGPITDPFALTTALDL
jgi:hypothetical protein